MGVYGTLKQGHHNYNTFLSPRKPIVAGKFDIPYTLYSNGRYPMLVRKDHSEVFLEIYEITMELFRKIHDFEAPFGYHVETIAIEGRKVNLFVYDKAEAPPEFKLVAEGNFHAEIDW